jgi:hypothetical protein
MRASEYCRADYSDRHPLGDGSGQFYKGNLHTHTTVTDGAFSQQETVDRYRQAGYDFLSLTDHYIYTRGEDLQTGDLVLFPGVEINYDDKEHYLFDHLVGILTRPQCGGYADGEEVKPYPPSSGWSVQRMINALRQTGHFVIYAHPHWSHRDARDLAALEGIDAVEVYNTCCDVRFACGYSDQHYDGLLMRGKQALAVCTDDTHTPECFFGGWICVYAAQKTHEAIAQALHAGRFYASNGPQIFDYRLQNGEVCVTCSPASSISFITYDHWGRTLRGQDMTHASFKLRGDESFVRVQVQDAHGAVAYTQPMFFY